MLWGLFPSKRYNNLQVIAVLDVLWYNNLKIKNSLDSKMRFYIMKYSIRKISFVTLCILMIISTLVPTVSAAEDNKYYLGNVVNAGKDTGYSKSNKITEDDPHFGWELGEFFVSGYSDEEKDENGNSVFLKNVGDKVTLWFCLNQDINKLNKNKKLSISEDTNGYDEYFGIEKTNFKKGTLIVRKKDSENHWGKPTIYTNYLEANAKKEAYTQVELFEEGDYEVALNYEIKETNLDIFGWKPLPSYYNYRIFFRFSVRNGNCMVYPFDTKTGAELTNSAFTENGFYLDLANSKYLNINIKKEILNEGAEGLVEDVRFNKPAKDGEQFIEEGIYTITVTNEYTKQETVKKIYVGTNEVLKAHVATGFSIDEIKHQISLGAKVGENGELIPVSNKTGNQTETTDNNVSSSDETKIDYTLYFIIAVGALIVIIMVIIILAVCKKKKVIISEKNEGGLPE